MLVENLIKSGIVEQDPANENKVIFNVPIYITKQAVEAGGFQAFAKQYGYQEKILVEDELIDNPKTVYRACQEVIWGFVTDVFKAAMLQSVRERAESKALEEIENLLK